MQIIAPTLDREEEANEANVEEIISLLPEKSDPYAILSQSEFTYIQVLWTNDGFHLEYQENDLMHHFQLKNLLSQIQVISIFKKYLKGESSWKSELSFQKKDITSFRYKIGYHIGAFCGGFLKGFKEVRAKKVQKI